MTKTKTPAKTSAQIREEATAKDLDAYVALACKLKRHPSRSDLADVGITRDMFRARFKNLDGFKAAAKGHAPEQMMKILDGDLFTEERFSSLEKQVKTFKRFVVTTAVTGCTVHPGFLASLQHYCKVNDAMLLVLTSEDPAAVATHGQWIDPTLAEMNLVFKDLRLNSNCFISTIKLSAKHINPTTGLGRIGQRCGSYIFASPKQQLDMVATSNSALPHAVMSTGACTIADYHSERYFSKRTAAIAEHDHVLGAIVVEVENDKVFHFRQVQCDADGCFPDNGTLYCQGEHEAYAPAAIIGGDLHDGESDEEALNAFVYGDQSVTRVTKVRRLVVHDGFNGKSISHHEINNAVQRARHAAHNLLSLEAELRHYAATLNRFGEIYDEIVLVASNHDEFLHRYLADARYVEDAPNHRLSLDLAAAYIDGKNPLQVAMERFGLKDPEKFIWLKRDEDFKIAGIELGAHGDKGSNGARGSLQAMEAAYGSSVSGHAHTPKILRNAWQVGTWSKLKLDYNVGASSWLHTACLVYPNGCRQLINSIFGNWRSAPTGKTRRKVAA